MSAYPLIAAYLKKCGMTLRAINDILHRKRIESLFALLAAQTCTKVTVAQPACAKLTNYKKPSRDLASFQFAGNLMRAIIVCPACMAGHIMRMMSCVSRSSAQDSTRRKQKVIQQLIYSATEARSVQLVHTDRSVCRSINQFINKSTLFLTG